ncbi:MAG: type I restriction enzyme HsdR N-terminal domain-containing protein [Chitinophagales bacterium]|nr:type I restriction enzyme HsdR N-terminal domain-containing protein [Chitinophagales bacterium]
MKETLHSTILSVVAKYEKKRDYYSTNETATRTQLIDPILSSLGWDLSDPDTVLPNQKNENGDIPDYVLLRNSEKILVVEAKKIGISLKNDKIISQITKYSSRPKIKFGVLTNGIQWLVLELDSKQSFEDRIVIEVDLATTYDNYDTEINKLLCISYEEIEKLESKRIQTKLEEAWKIHFDDICNAATLNLSPKVKNINTEEIRKFVSQKLSTDENFLNIPKHTTDIGQISAVSATVSSPEPLISTPANISTKRKAPQSTLKVTFPNEKTIFHTKAKDVFLQTITTIGAEQVMKIGLICCGLPLVSLQGNQQYDTHIISDKYYVITNTDTKTKADYLKTISEKLNLGLLIEVILKKDIHTQN